MRGCLIALPISLAMWAGILWAASSALTVWNDGGGRVSEYLVRNLRHDEIRILGRCYSACTLALKHENVCVGPGARLFFHAPRNPMGKIDRLATQTFTKMYPAWVQFWIVRHGGLRKDFIEMPRQVFIKHVRQCDG